MNEFNIITKFVIDHQYFEEVDVDSICYHPKCDDFGDNVNYLDNVVDIVSFSSFKSIILFGKCEQYRPNQFSKLIKKLLESQKIIIKKL